ncbi:restriction endonuclease [Mycobacterium intermedium]|nr:restriction endonuclease [Mycobacterium intermedium]MCV6965970.1 restriction endonuclease [Mycobacterium intermedium]
MQAVLAIIAILVVAALLVKYWFVVLPVAVAVFVGAALNARAKSKREQEARALAVEQAEKARIAEETQARKAAEAAAIAAKREREAAEARRMAYERQRWAEGANFDELEVARVVAAAAGLVPQVEAENRRIEACIRDLTNLLADGLAHMRQTPPEWTYLQAREGDPDGVTAYATAVLDSMVLPAGIQPSAKVAYSRDSRQLVVEFELPTVKVVPEVKSYRYVKSRDSITKAARPATQIKSMYASVIAQLSLLCLAHVFASDTGGNIDVVVFNGIVETLDPRSGRPVRPCLLTVRVTRDVFTEFELAHVDPGACLKHLSASVSRSPAELLPVRPLLEFSMVDPRFIAETDTLGAMDDRPNLMELTPAEFESLIQNLFTNMGLEAKQTRSSRDGGVDCVAYDTRPIFGGKVVIQAKRYKHTVGVSAVRDLFGTLQNEGASKGILVTTSGYGKASFEFAQNKPIELIDGGNLLYLLEEHADMKAKIEMPDDWRDPVPDSGDSEFAL